MSNVLARLLEELEARLTGQMMNRTQDMIAEALRLANRSRGEVVRAQERAGMAIIAFGDADESTTAAAPTRVAVIEAEIDDMSAQLFGVVMDRLLAEGALDVFYTSVQMKKNRPGTLLTIVAPPDRRDRLTSLVFSETTSIGVRYREMARECLERETVSVETALGAVRMKVARRNGQVLNVSPEFDDCVRLAEATGRPVKDVQAMAAKAYLERRSEESGPKTRDERPETT